MRIEDKFAQNEVLFNSKFKNITNDKSAEENSDQIGFGDVLKKVMDDTNDKMLKSDSTATSFIKGEDVNIDEVMIKGQEASLSLQFLTQTRDRLLEGYNQLSRLQL
jgi:flagellar hook-basal body complex protein FliE